MVALADHQVAFNGVVMGPGTPYRLHSLVGFRGLPTLANKDLPKAIRDGSYAGYDVNVERILQVVLTVTSLANTAADFEANLEALEAATVPIFDPADLLAVSHKLPGRTQRRYVGRPRQHLDTLDPTYVNRFSKVTLQWQCPDPTIYDDNLTTTMIAAGGSIVNAGAWPSRPVLTVTPGGSPVTITNTTDSANKVVLATSATGAIPSPCVVDLLAETVVDGSGANRADVLDPSTTWWALVPGNNDLTISGGSMTVAWRSAWII